ncbi:MAG: HigA family addiction module antidote protein [Enterobacteriaceae bacterium]|jgi:addiction module HigA family antidote|nr:HigA family addiction module antidote protein [Enterobacteriaceae bacterium]
MMIMHNPAHPGEVLREFLDGISITQAAASLGVTRATLSRIMNGHASITADMAWRLSEALDTSAELWLGMQSQYDLWQAAQKPRPHITPILRHS